jgi:antitoxin component YwqK of YwqJK toxin-antitoxin module
MKKSIILLFLVSIQAFSQSKEVIYFDEYWQPTTKENHAFYRQLPLKKVGELELIQDFYKNGNMQMQGYVFANNHEEYVGDIYWYDENGFDKNFSQYANETKNETLTYYYPNGKIWKKIQYQNGVKEGKTIVYKEDGKVLLSGIYKKGKPFKGNFDSNCTNFDYLNENNQIEANIREIPNEPLDEPFESTQVDSAATYIEPIESIEVETETKKLFINKQLFYVNSNQLAQEITYSFADNDYADYDMVEIKNYDKFGKLIQNIASNEIEYGYRLKNGIQFTFFTQNNFAVGINSKSSIKDESKNGKSITYYTNGNIKLEENYINGNLEGEVVEYQENGSVKTKRIYKDNEPFSGDFVIEFNPEVFIYATYINGKMEGNIVAKTENDSIITQGIYKNGQPFKGTFFGSTEELDHNEINTIENFVQNGKQIYFSYDYKKPSLSSMVINGKKEGETIFYNDDGTIKSALIYKNNEPFEGVFSDDNEEITYKNGQLTKVETTEKYFQHNAKQIIEYENKLPKKVQFDKVFLISETSKETYTGIFKNGKPFDGYFCDLKNEIKTIDYYENGEQKFQYSNDYLKNMDNYQYPVYDLKAVYKNNKIIDGIEYQRGSKFLIQKHWKNENLQAIDLDLYAMHYFNRIHFEIKKEGIEISELKSDAKIIIEEKDKTIIKMLVSNNRILQTNSVKYEHINQPLTSNSNVIYFIKNNEIKCQVYTFSKIQKDSINENEEQFIQTILSKIYPNLDFEANSIPDYFNQISKVLNVTDDKKDTFLLFNKDFDENANHDDISFVKIDENANPVYGTHIIKSNDNLYHLKRYSDAKLILSKENISIAEIKKIIKQMYQEE